MANQIPHGKVEGGVMSFLEEQECWKCLQQNINAAERIHNLLNNNLMEWARPSNIVSMFLLRNYVEEGGSKLNFVPYWKLVDQRINTAGNSFYRDNNESCFVICNDLIWDNKVTSQLQENSLYKHEELKTRCLLSHFDHASNQHKRKKTAQLVSSFVIAIIAFLWIFFDICSQSPVFQLLPLCKGLGPFFKWFPLLKLLGLVLFVWAVAITILVGARLSRMQSAMFIFWAILMFVKSANSFTAVYVSILGIFLIGVVYARGKATRK